MRRITAKIQVRDNQEDHGVLAKRKRSKRRKGWTGKDWDRCI